MVNKVFDHLTEKACFRRGRRIDQVFLVILLWPEIIRESDRELAGVVVGSIELHPNRGVVCR